MGQRSRRPVPGRSCRSWIGEERCHVCQVPTNCRALGDALRMSSTLILRFALLGSISTSQQRCLNLSFSSLTAKERFNTCVSFYILACSHSTTEREPDTTAQHRSLPQSALLGEPTTSEIYVKHHLGVVVVSGEERRNKTGHVFITVEARGRAEPRLSVRSYFCMCLKFFHNTKQSLC